MASEIKLLLLIVAAITGLSQAQDQVGYCPPNSNEGKDFYFAIPLLTYDASSKTITLYIASDRNGTARLEYPADSMNRTYHINYGQTAIQLSAHTTSTFDSISHQGIRLTSDVNIAVTMFVHESSVYMAEILALPTTELSINYTVPNAKPFDSSYPNELIVVGTQDNTKLTVIFPTYIRSIAKTIYFDSLDTYIFKSSSDLSGVRVTSNKPVAVLSGSNAARVPSFHPKTYGESLAEFLPPDNYAGKMFIVPDLPGRSAYTVRVLATEPNTTVTFYNSSKTYTYRLHPGNADEFAFGKHGVAITADKGVMVYQYAVSSDSDAHGNGAFMRNIPSVASYVTLAKFDVQKDESSSSMRNIVQVIVPYGETVTVDDSDALTLTGVVRTDYRFGNLSYYSVLRFDLPKGYHMIEGGTVPFGALIQGLKDHTRAGYGNVLAMRNPRCGLPHPTLPVTTANTTLATTNSSVGEKLCLSCDDVTHIYLCDVFERCPSSEVCFVEQYKNYAHQVRYRMGCRNTAGCGKMTREQHSEVDLPTTHIDKRVTLCVECCHGNFCNTQGCGATGIPPMTSRGPLCLSCAHVQNPAECNTLAYCQQNEVCYVGKSNLFGDVMSYSYGCEAQQCRPGLHGRILCEQCCGDDFCNHSCNSTAITSIIG